MPMARLWLTLLAVTALKEVMSQMLSAMEMLQIHEGMVQGYKVPAEECTHTSGIPLAIGLMRENVDSENSASKGRPGNWGAAYYTMSYLHPQLTSKSGKLETGTFAPQLQLTTQSLHDSIDSRVVCLRPDMQYVFKLSRNPNSFEIGALVGKTDFLSPEDTLHISTWDGVYKSRLRRHSVNAEGVSHYSHVYYYAPQFRAPTQEPTAYPTWSRSPTVKPTTVRQSGQEQSCLESLSGYDASSWSLKDYCSLYSTTATCTTPDVADFSCVPDSLNSQACGATFCHTFSLLASGACTKLSLADTNVTMQSQINDQCLAAYVSSTFKASDVSYVNWRLALTIRGANATQLVSHLPSQLAIRQVVSRFIPGVPLSSVTFETVEKIDMTHSPTRSPSTLRVTQKSAKPTYSANSIMVKPKSEMSPAERREINATRVRWHSRSPTKHPTPDASTWTSFPTRSKAPTSPTRRTRFPTPPATAKPTAKPTFPRHSTLNATGVVVELSITCAVQSMGFEDEQSAYDDAIINLYNAATSSALTFALKDNAVKLNATAVQYGVVLGKDVVLTSLGTLPPSVTPVSSTTETANTDIIAGAAAGAVGGVAVVGGVAYKVMSAGKDAVQVVPMEALSGMDGVVLQSF